MGRETVSLVGTTSEVEHTVSIPQRLLYQMLYCTMSCNNYSLIINYLLIINYSKQSECQLNHGTVTMSLFITGNLSASMYNIIIHNLFVRNLSQWYYFSDGGEIYYIMIIQSIYRSLVSNCLLIRSVFRSKLTRECESLIMLSKCSIEMLFEGDNFDVNFFTKSIRKIPSSTSSW